MGEHAPILTRAEAAEYLRVSPGFLDGQVKRGNIQLTRQGRRVFFARAELDAYLQRCTEGTCCTNEAATGGASGSTPAKQSGRAREKRTEERLRKSLLASGSSGPQSPQSGQGAA